jgi:ABC-type glycerol-3-phosphate transport system permease component
MLAVVGALIPLIVIYERIGLVDSRFGMILCIRPRRRPH